MARIFSVVCPECGGKFQCHYSDLRHKRVKLVCPYCGLSFEQEESPQIEE